MRPRSLHQLAAELGAPAFDAAGIVIERISTDSRSSQPGDLFVAVVGESVDGNAYVESAVANGASAVLTSRNDLAGVPRIQCEDTLEALRDLAVLARNDIAVPVIAVTGSSGKTSTKDLLACALPNAWASPRSFNNEVGVPLTILGAPEGIDYLVAEVGSRGRGHITYLMPAVKPDVSVITNLGVVHLETFGTTDDLADAKYELIEGLSAEGVAVLPAGERRLHRDFAGRTITFGAEESADVRIGEVTIDASGYPSFDLFAEGRRARVDLQVAGAHQALNAAAAVAAGTAVGVDMERLVAGMGQAVGSAWRMEIHRGRFTVVNDAYNANPDSMEAAMRTVAAMPGRHVAVLGMMAELGPLETSEHERIGGLAADLGFAAVITVGDEPGIARGAGPIARSVADPGEAYDVVNRVVGDGDVVLVKASRAIGLEQLALQLAEEATA
ncbi:MAG: UDP-N-acetylmuramoyl-tripeptide--D-alanyl-D-alanine ligase [Acidimicrobiia bacterium]|nr:UDP-N-acetylmuramoyl-tripeptide--D-alanyl-D-alanine ligase [Acidimicrobiia bacterium]